MYISNEMKHKFIYDNYHGNIEFTAFEEYLLKEPLFNRLHQIIQNSTAYLVYPCCKTSRFEHSIGTVNIASQIYIYGLNNSIKKLDYLSDKSNFLIQIIEKKRKELKLFLDKKSGGTKSEQFEKYLKNDLKITHIKKLIEHEKFKSTLIDLIGNGNFLHLNSNNEYSNTQYVTSLLLFQGVRLYALSHDIGHLPFSHLFEDAIVSVYQYLESKGTRDSHEKIIYDSINKLVSKKSDNPKKNQIHEIIGKNLTKNTLECIRRQIYTKKDDDYLKLFLLYIIEGIYEEIVKGKYGELNALFNIISGIIDADRLDYLQRDGRNSGIAISVGNIERIIKMFCLAKLDSKTGSKDNYLFIPSIQSLHDIEEILKVRFSIYKYLISHHAVKRSDFILQNVIAQKIIKEIPNIIKSKDKGLKALALYDVISKSSELMEYKSDDNKKINYQFCQLTDFWLMSLLSNEYLDLFLNEKENKDDYFYLLKEVFENSRSFKSLWKRDYEFDNFLIKLGESIQKQIKINDFPNNNGVETLINELKEVLFSQSINSEKKARIIIELLYDKFKNELWLKIEKTLIIENIIFLVTKPKLKNGFDSEELFIIDIKDQNEIKNIDQISGIKNNIQMEIDRSISFFVYYFNKSTVLNNNIEVAIEKEIISIIINLIKQEICVPNLTLQEKS